MKGWQYRWFVLNPDVGRLEYYEVGLSYIIFHYIKNQKLPFDAGILYKEFRF